MSELTEYEKERLARIAENKKLLQQLQLDTASRASRDGTPEIKPKPVKRKAPSDAKVARSIAQQPVSTIRTRSRTERTASLASRDPEAARRKQEKEEEEEQQRLLEVKKAKHE